MDPHQTNPNLSCRCHLSLSLSQINNILESHSPLSDTAVTSPPHTEALLIPLQAPIFNATALTSFDLRCLFWRFELLICFCGFWSLWLLNFDFLWAQFDLCLMIFDQWAWICGSTCLLNYGFWSLWSLSLWYEMVEWVFDLWVSLYEFEIDCSALHW